MSVYVSLVWVNLSTKVSLDHQEETLKRRANAPNSRSPANSPNNATQYNSGGLVVVVCVVVVIVLSHEPDNNNKQILARFKWASDCQLVGRLYGRH